MRYVHLVTTQTDRAIAAMTTAGIPRPERIRAARDLRGLTQRETVERMAEPISTAALSQIESGKTRPSASTLICLADALDVPPDFFATYWSEAGTEDVLSQITYFRDLAATPAKERRRAAANTLLLSDLIGQLEAAIKLPRVDVPRYSAGPQASRQEIDDIAQAVRGEWDLSDDQPISNAVHAVESHGVPVARFELGNNQVSAFSVRLTRRPLILLASTTANYARSRFNVAHELGHIVMHAEADPNDRQIEPQAHSFAASFLLPSSVALDILPRRIDNLGWSRLAEIKRDWGISLAALLFRGRELGLLTPDSYRNAMKYMSVRGWRRSEPGDRQMGPAESPTLIEKAIRMAMSENGVSREELIDNMRLPVQDVLRIVHASRDARPSLRI